MYFIYFKIALRNIFKYKSIAAIHLLGLSLGISACLIIYLIAQYELSTDAFHPNKERIFRVVGNSSLKGSPNESPMGFVPYGLPAILKNEVTGMEKTAAFINMESSVKIIRPDGSAASFDRRNMETGDAEIVLATPEYFDIFKYEWLIGNPQTALQGPNEVVLSLKKAQKYFGDIPVADMIGRGVIYRDSLLTSVTGIVKEWEHPTDFTFTDFISHATIRKSFLNKEINLDELTDIWSNSQAFVQIDPHTSIKSVEAQFSVISQKYFADQIVYKPALQPLSELHFNARLIDNYSRKANLSNLYGLITIAGFILLLATINFINLSTAQSVQRAKEIGVRRAIGSSRGQIIVQFLSETFLLATLASCISVVCIPLIVNTFQSFLPGHFTIQWNSSHVVFLVLLIMATTLLAGLYPAILLSGWQPTRVLRGQSIGQKKESLLLRKNLIVFQFIVSFVFIIAAFVFHRQNHFLRHKDLGFNANAIISMTTPRGQNAEKMSLLHSKINVLSGVQRTALQLYDLMGSDFSKYLIEIKSGDEVRKLEVVNKGGDEHLLDLYGLTLIAGRNIHQSDQDKGLLVNETLVKLQNWANPETALGKEIWIGPAPFVIVGVLKDFHQGSMRLEIEPTIIEYTNETQSIAVKLNGKDPEELVSNIAQIEAAWGAVFPGHKFRYHWVEENIAKIIEEERKYSKLINAATLIAIFISCLGLYGLTMFMTLYRAKEIGIRKVLGASATSILLNLNREVMILLGISFAIGSVIALRCVDLWLNNFAYRVPVQWWMFALPAFILFLLAILTICVQGIKISLENPVKSLKSE